MSFVVWRDLEIFKEPISYKLIFKNTTILKVKVTSYSQKYDKAVLKGWNMIILSILD